MADTTKTKFGLRPAPGDDSKVSGFAVTPVEGLDPTEIPKLPVNPEEVLELLKARLALDHGVLTQLSAAVNMPGYQSAHEQPRSWLSKDASPSSPDITPSPVVIGIAELEAMSASDEAVPEEQRLTPAEPVASVRVRQASGAPPAPESSWASAEAWTSQRLGSVAGSLYFPPTKPPESWQKGSSDEPLVQVVPDCDSKIRTAKSLRRNSNWPTPSYLSELKQRPSILWVSGASLLLLLGLATLVASSHRVSGSPPPAAPVPLSPPPVAAVPSVDAGLGPIEPAASAQPAPSDGAKLPNRVRSKGRIDDTLKSTPPKAAIPLAPKTKPLVF